MIEMIMMQDDTRTHLQCFEAIHGNEPEAV